MSHVCLVCHDVLPETCDRCDGEFQDECVFECDDGSGCLHCCVVCATEPPEAHERSDGTVCDGSRWDVVTLAASGAVRQPI